MRTIEQLREEIAIRKALDLPRIELTIEERARAFGDCSYDYRDNSVRIQLMIERKAKGLKLTPHDLKELKSYLKNITL